LHFSGAQERGDGVDELNDEMICNFAATLECNGLNDSEIVARELVKLVRLFSIYMKPGEVPSTISRFGGGPEWMDAKIGQDSG